MDRSIRTIDLSCHLVMQSIILTLNGISVESCKLLMDGQHAQHRMTEVRTAPIEMLHPEAQRPRGALKCQSAKASNLLKFDSPVNAATSSLKEAPGFGHPAQPATDNLHTAALAPTPLCIARLMRDSRQMP